MGWIDGCGLALEREGAFMGMGKDGCGDGGRQTRGR